MQHRRNIALCWDIGGRRCTIAAKASKRSIKKKDEVDEKSISITYDLPTLPSAQHKAGLAGLLLLVESMKRRRMGPLPEITGLSPLGCTIAFTNENLQLILDELYDAENFEVIVKSKWKGKEPLRVKEIEIVNEETGEVKREPRYVYETPAPKLAFLEALGISGGREGWLKLRRDALWGTLRSIPKTREGYLDRIAGQSASRSGLSKIWPELVKQRDAIKKGSLRTVEVPSNLMIGAQAHSAEKVKFTGPADQTLLLHFWQVSSLVYVPQIIDRDGKAQLDNSYIFAIPEVAHLTDFGEDFLYVLGELGTELTGYRPAGAVVSIPEEGGLDYMSLLLERVLKKVEQTAFFDSVSAIEVLHLKKKGNNVAMLSSHRLEPDDDMLRDFEYIRRTYKSPLFRAHRIRNLVAGQPWFAGFADLAAITPAKLLMNHSGAPWVARQLSRDASKKFRLLQDD